MQDRTRDLILRLLGPTALEAPLDSAEAAPDTPRLQLDAPGSDPGGVRLRLRDPDDPNAGTLQGPGDAPRLRLAEPGSGGLRLSSP
jgi:hypothetical protein